MTNEQQNIWNRIREFELDNPSSSLTFTERLARENGWNMEFAIRTVYEYKKFIFMMCVAPHPLTPSDQVDQAWHLHLIYSYSYWVDLCQNTIGRPLHHGPTKGGSAEGDKFHDLYTKTLELYHALFEREPEKDIWPAAALRFRNDRFQRISQAKNWIIPKPAWFKS